MLIGFLHKLLRPPSAEEEEHERWWVGRVEVGASGVNEGGARGGKFRDVWSVWVREELVVVACVGPERGSSYTAGPDVRSDRSR
jgi:hypothetical protein